MFLFSFQRVFLVNFNRVNVTIIESFSHFQNFPIPCVFCGIFFPEFLDKSLLTDLREKRLFTDVISAFWNTIRKHLFQIKLTMMSIISYS